MSDKQWWEIQDPETVLAQALQRSRARLGDVVVARVDVDSQQVVGTKTLQVPDAWSADLDATDDEERRWRASSRLSELARSTAEELAPQRQWRQDGRGGYTGVFITIVCREGRVIDTAAEWRWINGWRYSNHFCDGFNGDVYVVTPHGWTGVMDHRAGRDPSLGAEPAQPHLRAV